VGAVAYADGEQGVDACGVSVGDDFWEVGVVVQVAVRVDDLDGELLSALFILMGRGWREANAKDAKGAKVRKG
jgi:hypothetical protein